MVETNQIIRENDFSKVVYYLILQVQNWSDKKIIK
jgi:hypothetical protein